MDPANSDNVRNNEIKKSSVKKKKVKSSSVKNEHSVRKNSGKLQVAKLSKWQSEQNLSQTHVASHTSPYQSPAQQDRRRSISLCRITGLSHSLDEPHYFPSRSDFPYFGRRSSCHITYGHEVLGDNFHFPVFDPTVKSKKKDDPTCSSTNPIQNGTLESKKITKLPFTKIDLSENPSQLLKKKFKQKSLVSEDDNNADNKSWNEPLHCSKSIQHAKGKIVSNSLPCDKSLSLNEVDLSKSIDINNNLLDTSSADEANRSTGSSATQCDAQVLISLA